jgi:branched-chain amino acid transport system permease protein
MSGQLPDRIQHNIQGTSFVQDDLGRSWQLARYALLVAFVIALLYLPQNSARYGLTLISLWAIYTIAVQGLNLTLGYAGQISLAQAGFMGIGAYASTLLVQESGLTFWLAMPAAALVCFAIGALVGFPALRVKGHFLAFVTLGFNGLVVLVLRNEAWLTGGSLGLRVDRPSLLGIDNLKFAYFCLIMLGIVTFCVWYMIRSPWGRAFQALRDNSIRAESLGISITTYTVLAFALGSAIAGIAGSMLALHTEYIEPVGFGLPRSLLFLLMVMVGGRGTLIGPFIGTAFVVLVPEYMRFTEEYYLMIFATGVILMMIFFPQGVAGIVPIFRKYVIQRGRANS